TRHPRQRGSTERRTRESACRNSLFQRAGGHPLFAAPSATNPARPEPATHKRPCFDSTFCGSPVTVNTLGEFRVWTRRARLLIMPGPLPREVRHVALESFLAAHDSLVGRGRAHATCGDRDIGRNGGASLEPRDARCEARSLLRSGRDTVLRD